MPYMLIRHKVGDFARWKTVYDAHAGTRKAGGSRGARLLRNADDPREVVILLEWSDLDSARRFAKSDELKQAMAKAGVADRPDVYFLDEAGSSDG
jgi:heme-degrading monooxygenase HmoA